VTTFAGCGIPGYEDGSAQNAQFNMPAKLVFDSARGVVFVSEQGDHIRVIDVHNRLCSTISIASFNSPNGLCWIPSRGVLAVADTFNHGVRILSFADLQPSA
jgi:sugar lactone lactonase YvrE